MMIAPIRTRLVRTVTVQSRVSAPERICTMESTDARMDTIPKIVMMFRMVSFFFYSRASCWDVRMFNLSTMSVSAWLTPFTSMR